jgi:hypothetical protein
VRRAGGTRWLVVAAVASVASSACGAPAADEATGGVREAIFNGSLAGPGSPILYFLEPQGNCSAVLIAPNLVVTARHCVSPFTEGSFECTPEGTLSSSGTGGQLGSDDNPSDLRFFTQASVAAGVPAANGTPDAIGFAIVSTGAPTICSDDLAFVILSRPIAGVAPAPIRLDNTTKRGEMVAVFGYGETANAGDPLALRVNDTAQIIGVGPTTPPMFTQPAPLRAVSVGPGAVACSGDSGGGILSSATGAVIAVSSLAPQTTTAAGSCGTGSVSSLTGPDLADYAALAFSAFDEAGATPIPEPLPDAGSDSGTGPPADLGLPLGATGGSCSASVAPRRDKEWPAIPGVVCLGAAVVVARRRMRTARIASL